MADPVAVFRALLEDWRRVMDLVGPGEVGPHFEDAERAIVGLEAQGRWADLGSGAGFPGIILAIRYPAAQVSLVERRQKRVAFLREVVARAGLVNAEVCEQDSATLEKGAWDGVISRAYRPPAEYLLEAAGLLRVGGTAVLLTAGDTPVPPPGLEQFHVERYAVERKPRASVRFRRGSPPPP